ACAARAAAATCSSGRRRTRTPPSRPRSTHTPSFESPRSSPAASAPRPAPSEPAPSDRASQPRERYRLRKAVAVIDLHDEPVLVAPPPLRLPRSALDGPDPALHGERHPPEPLAVNVRPRVRLERAPQDGLCDERPPVGRRETRDALDHRGARPAASPRIE